MGRVRVAAQRVHHPAVEVVERAGDVFGNRFRERFTTVGARFDSQPAAEALAVVRSLDSDSALAYLHAIQREIFVGAADPSDSSMLIRVAVSLGFSERDFRTLFASASVAEQAEADYDRAAALGVDLVPTLFVQTPGGPKRVFAGWKNPEAWDLDLAVSTGAVPD